MQMAADFWANPQNQIMTWLVLSYLAQTVGRAIPNDQTGFLGFVRKLAKIVGLYVDNKAKPGVDIDYVAESIGPRRGPDGKFLKRGE